MQKKNGLNDENVVGVVFPIRKMESAFRQANPNIGVITVANSPGFQNRLIDGMYRQYIAENFI